MKSSNKLIADTLTGEVLEMPKYRTNDNFVLGQCDKDMETVKGKSNSVPNMAYTVKEILERFTRGLPLSIEKNGEYDELDFDGNESENPIDVTEVEEKLTEVNSRIAEKKARKASLKEEVLGGENKTPDITEAKKADKTEEEV